MLRTILTAISPNAEKDDVRLALSLLFQPWRWRAGKAVQRLESQFASLFEGECVAFSSGRSSLYAILASLDLQATDEVLLQSFTCVAVADPILWAGVRPVYVDCNPETFTMDPDDLERKITHRSKVLIVQHTFGQPAEMNRLMEMAQEHGLFVIEDCAHALGGQYHGKALGSFGQAAFFSFGRDKVISSVFGGMAVVRKPWVKQRVREHQKKLVHPSRVWIFQQLAHPIVMSFAKATYDWMGLGKVLIEIAKRTHLISRAVLPLEKRGGKPGFVDYHMPNALALLVIRQLKKLDRFNDHRARIAKVYQEGLRDIVNLKMEGEYKDRVWLRFSVILETCDRRDQLARVAKSHGILLGDWYDVPVAPSGVQPSVIQYVPGSCPTAERLAQTVINLPTHIGISIEDAKRIISVIKDVCH